ncbi:integrase, catalytic region, zinc finger, CCHC-type containing protein [Tanacetum coccineum]
MTTLTEFMILSAADNRPPMLEKDLYDSWKGRMELYMQNREHGRMILEFVEHSPLIWPMIEENGVTRTKKYEELVANDLWQRIQLLMQGTSLTKQDMECKLYDAFDKFAHIKEESLHQYYLRFTQLINDMNIYKMYLEQFQVNTKFLNSLPPEWSKFVTDVKFVKDLHTTNFDQLNAYLEQHELYANEVRIMRERSQDPLALVANHQMTSSHFNTYQSSYNNPQSPFPNAYSSTVHQDACLQPQSIPQIEYIVSTVNQQTHLAEFPQIDSGLAVPMFKQGDDLIDAINKKMTFLSSVITSRFPSTNNQLRNSSNPRQQETIHDGRVIVQPIEGRQSSFAAGTSGTRANISGTEGIIQCPKPKRKRDATWFRDKVLLVKAQGSGNFSNEEELAFLADPGVCRRSIKAVLMANLSSYGSDVLSELLGYVRDTCPDIHKPSEKLFAVTPIKKKKVVRLTSNTQKKNKVEDHSRIVKSCLNKPNCVVEPCGNANVQHSKLNTNSELMPMRVASINGKKYILVIMDDYSRYTWVKFLASKDEAPDFIIKFLKMIQAEAVATACYTQNRSIIQYRHGKSPYELLHDRKPDLSYLHVFGALCYPNNESKNLGKLQAKADIGLVSNPVPQQPLADAPRAVDIADSPVSTSIDQDAP